MCLPYPNPTLTCIMCARRPHHEELRMWASQLLLSKSSLLEALQQQVRAGPHLGIAQQCPGP